MDSYLMTINTMHNRQPQLSQSGNPYKLSNRYKNAYLKQANSAVISVFEHQRLTAQDFRQAADFDWLLAQEFEVFSLKRQHGQWQLKVGHYVGIIMLPSGMTLEILPKAIANPSDHSSKSNSSKNNDVALTRQWVQQMLNDLFHKDNDRRPHRKNLGQISNNLQPLSLEPLHTLPLSEWLANQFLQLLSRYQPTQHYQASIQNQARLQGKLLVKEQLRRNRTQPHKFVSEVSSLSEEMLSNRLIKSALVLLEPLLVRSKHLLAWQAVTACNQHELRQLDALYLAAKRQLTIQPLMRQQLQSVQQLLEWAYWLLKRQQVQVGSFYRPNNAKNSSTAAIKQPRLCVLFNMNQAFEQWASLCIAMSFEQLDKNYQTLYQSQHSWLRDQWGQNCLSMRPDLLIGQRSFNTNNSATQSTFTCSHVIDIKWKALAQANSISASDAYQLTSYAQAYQAEQVWLVYPVAEVVINNSTDNLINSITDNIRRPTMLRQHGLNERSNNINQAELWLMPFNVLTATLNDWPLAEHED